MEKTGKGKRRTTGVRTRMAPSPTGKIHIGTAQTTLFNYLLAKHSKGKLVLRMDDTDRERSKREFERNIIEGLKWLGLSWDEGPDVGGPYEPYRQSQREGIYRKYVEKLLKSGWAYRCFCTEEELERERQESRRRKDPAYKYSGKCRGLSRAKVEENMKAGKPFTIRVRTDLAKEKVVVDDQIRGKVEVEPDDVGDFIVVRSDNSPVLLLTATIDDIEMKINQAIRGEDMLNVSFRMWFVFKALGKEMPKYGHKPFMYAQDGRKLSKRHGATGIDEFREQGYLPEAILNYLFFVGYTPEDEKKEFWSLEEMVKDFDWGHFQHGMPRFDYKKLDWYNAEYIRRMSDEELGERLKEYLSIRHPELDSGSESDRAKPNKILKPAKGEAMQVQNDKETRKLLTRIAPLVKERLTTLGEFEGLAGFFFQKPEIPKDGWRQNSHQHLEQALAALEKLEARSWKLETLNTVLMGVVEKGGFKTGEFFMSLRLAICGKKVTPPLTESAEILGKEETMIRLERATKVVTIPDRK